MGLVITLAILVLMAIMPFSGLSRVAGVLMAPGLFVARSAYGGLHGGEPIVIMFFTNFLFYLVTATLLVACYRHFRDLD